MQIGSTRREVLGLAFHLALGLVLAPGCSPKQSQTAPASPPSAAGTSLFADVAVRAGVRFTETNGAEGRFRYIESTPGGCAFFDYDNDGFLDLLLIQSGPSGPLAPGRTRPHCALYHNNGDGTFTDVTSGSGLDKDLGYAQGVAVGDYDNDGYDDLLITAYGRNILFHNTLGKRGAGSGGRASQGAAPIFEDATHSMGLDKPHSTGYATSAAFGDYNNDGRLDLYICYYSPWTPDRDKACHDAQGRQDYCTPEIYDAEVHQLWRNDGDHFTDVSDQAGITKVRGRGLAVAFLDYNDDGRQDIFVANDISENMLWRNNGDGTFTNVALQTGCAYSEGGQKMAAMGVGLADYDHSGHESLFVSNFSGLPNTLFKNVGHGQFQDMSAAAGVALPHMKFLTFGCEFFDYDADGQPDLITANGHVQLHADATMEGVTYAERKQLFHNIGHGVFQEIADPTLLGDLAQPTVARGLAVGDYDNDGRLDVLVNNQNGPAQLFHNQDHSANHWVSFKTVGVKSNRDGYHARLTLTAGGDRQFATVHSGSSYLSHSDSRVYFGLGAASRIEKVEIHWPSGVHDTLTDLSPDQIYIVTEGRGVTGRQKTRNRVAGRTL